jgi:hypothetical protein
MTRKDALRKLAEILAKKESIYFGPPANINHIHVREAYKAGFLAAARLLVPILTACEDTVWNFNNDFGRAGDELIRQALTDLDRRLEEK